MPPWRRLRRPAASTTTRIPWGWMALTVLAYAAAGLVMAAFPAPYWIWNFALGGAIVQAIALAGPYALSRFKVWSANVLSGLAILGTGAIATALGIALGFVGTDDLEAVVLPAIVLEVAGVGLLALVIAALGAIIGAATGDRLLRAFNRWQTSLILAAICILGLGLGGLLGLGLRG